MQEFISNDHNTKILIVDDDFSFSFLVAEALLQQGFEVEEIDNGIECVERVEEIAPDLIILDVLMPIQDGYETCKAIRHLANFKLTPILMMTGLEDEASIKAAYESGATDFIAKPFNQSLFLQRVQYILRNSSLTNDLIKTQRRLANANKLAKLSFWECDVKSKTVTWSDSITETLALGDIELKNSFDFLIDLIPVNERSKVNQWLSDALDGVKPEDITHRIITRDNETRYVRQMVEASFDDDSNIAELNGSILDVTAMQKSQDKIKKLAYYDSLTNLPNRAYSHELLIQTLKLAQREKRISALLFIDLDNFKRVNDTLGHDSGDLLLKAVTQRMKICLRQSDVIAFGEDDDSTNQLARLGGDEFTVLLPEIASPEGAAVVAQKIIKALSKPFNLNGNDVVTSPSIGISVFPDDASSAEECLKNSDMAMYHAKREGKNNYRFFNEEMNVESLKRMKYENALRSALSNDEFKLVYQPQIEMETGNMLGVESLIRWHSSELGFVPPDKFISIAEENGMIIPIGEWAFRTACKQAQEWRANNMQFKRVAVNVSSRQFAQINFDQIVKAILEETGLPAHMLDLEMTESLLMSHADASLEMLEKLKAIGVSISIDDFGTGYSSLAYLSKFPIDHLKIDKSFIDHVNTNANDSAIVNAVMAMAKAMGMRITAEGVETSEQLEFLKAYPSTEVQGYFFSKPLPPEEINQFYAQRQEFINGNTL